jgi:hypothetical protein
MNRKTEDKLCKEANAAWESTYDLDSQITKLQTTLGERWQFFCDNRIKLLYKKRPMRDAAIVEIISVGWHNQIKIRRNDTLKELWTNPFNLVGIWDGQWRHGKAF